MQMLATFGQIHVLDQENIRFDRVYAVLVEIKTLRGITVFLHVLEGPYQLCKL